MNVNRLFRSPIPLLLFTIVGCGTKAPSDGKAKDPSDRPASNIISYTGQPVPLDLLKPAAPAGPVAAQPVHGLDIVRRGLGTPKLRLSPVKEIANPATNRLPIHNPGGIDGDRPPR